MKKLQGHAYYCRKCNTLANTVYYVTCVPLFVFESTFSTSSTSEVSTSTHNAIRSVSVVSSSPSLSATRNQITYASISSSLTKKLVNTFQELILNSNIIDLRTTNDMYVCIQCNSLLYNVTARDFSTKAERDAIIKYIDYDTFYEFFNTDIQDLKITSLRQLKQLYKENFVINLSQLTTRQLAKLKNAMDLTS